MAFITKCLILSVFVAVTYCRSLLSEKNISEDLQDANCSCDWRYFKHYETKECILEKTDSCGCPQKFSCPVNESQQAPAKVCIYQNKEYKIGAKILTSDICQACRCRDGVPPSISCVIRECSEQTFESGKDCHLVYKESRCCPIGVECFENEAEIIPNTTCEYDGRYYPFGSKIYPVDDPCQICICDENWHGVDNASCYQQDCMFEKNRPQLNSGCIPVYHEKLCCPIEFYCPSSHNLSYSVLTSNATSEDYNISEGDECIFAGQSYPVGEELSINNPCVKCSCIVPPDFTCVHQTCSPSPSEENCDAVYKEGECCPSYECMLGDAEPELLPDCPTPLCADENCKIDIPYGQRCPTCICKGCPTPICADSSCRIEIPPDHECPTCVCGERFAELERNNFEQVQQASQIMDEFEVQQALEPGEDVDDSSEDIIPMMPKRTVSSEGQSPILEKMVSSDSEIAEVEDELLTNSVEDDSSPERVNSGSEEVRIADENNSMSLTEPKLNNTYNESVINESEKILQKRSDVSDAANNHQNKVTPIEQEETYQEDTQESNNTDLEREGMGSVENGEDFDDELESFKNRIFDSNKTVINHAISINHVVKVPPGCPTPMCEGPWCKIGILPGEKCPTCICKRPIPSEP